MGVLTICRVACFHSPKVYLVMMLLHVTRSHETALIRISEARLAGRIPASSIGKSTPSSKVACVVSCSTSAMSNSFLRERSASSPTIGGASRSSMARS